MLHKFWPRWGTSRHDAVGMERSRGSNANHSVDSFGNYYCLCALLKSIPIPALRKHLCLSCKVWGVETWDPTSYTSIVLVNTPL